MFLLPSSNWFVDFDKLQESFLVVYGDSGTPLNIEDGL